MSRGKLVALTALLVLLPWLGAHAAEVVVPDSTDPCLQKKSNLDGGFAPDLVKANEQIAICTIEIEKENNPLRRIALLYGRAEAYYHAKSTIRAILDIDAARALAPGVPEFFYARALFYSKLELLTLARSEADRAIQLGMKSANVYALRGYIEVLTGDFGAAATDLNFALAEAPDEPTALMARGMAFAEAGELDQAAHDYERALAVCRCNNAGLYLYLGRVHFASGEYEKALAEFEKAESLDPTQGAGQYIDDLKQAMSSTNGDTPNNGTDVPSRPIGGTHNCAAYDPYLSAKLGESGDVLIHYDVSESGSISGVGIEKSSGVERLDRAAIICVTHGWRNTPAIKNGIAVASPGHRAYLHFRSRDNEPMDDTRAKTLAGLGRYPEAIAEFNRNLDAAPNNAGTIFDRGLAYYAMRNYAAAEHDFDSVVRQDPHNDEALAGRKLAHDAIGVEKQQQ